MNDMIPKARELFLDAIKLPPSQWGPFIDGACGDDQPLRLRLGKLLEAHQEAGTLHQREKMMAVTTDLRDEHPGVHIGPYKLLEKIGEGGMGDVYVAEQKEPVRRKVALKVIKPGMDTRHVVARFEAERQALAMMNHPNIAKVLDAGATELGRPYFVMELVKGLPITEFCDQHRLDTRHRLQMFITVCQAVQHSHQKGLIHRDLKPSNIMVEMHDVVPVPKIIDFGVAKAIGQQLVDSTIYTGFGQMIGTPLYMSPEQAGQSSIDVDTRSDVYSLGVVLYELLTGHTPFERESLRSIGYEELRRMIREVDPPRPSARVSTLEANALSTVSDRRQVDPRKFSHQLRGELDWIVMKALEKDRSRRYESASSLAHDVERFLRHEPVQACPPSALYRAKKFVSRNQGRVVAAGLTAALLAVVVIGVVTSYFQHATALRQVSQDVQQSLAAAKTGIEAGDLSLAEKRLAEAKGRLGDHRYILTATAANVDKLASELDARQSDQERFNKFLKLALDAQNLMARDGGASGYANAREALAIFGVDIDPEWLKQLNQSSLSNNQKQQVQEAAYQTLVSFADFGVRWQHQWVNSKMVPTLTLEQSLDLLDRAKSFHEPTRAFWFVHREAEKQLKNEQAIQEDDRRFQSAVASSAWDYFLPGHTAGWSGDIDEAIRAYEAALRVQPDHYNSLYFLGIVIARNKPDRLGEAAGYFTACIALRPNSTIFRHRAQAYERLGNPEKAEADYSAAIATAEWDVQRYVAYKCRLGFYSVQGDVEKTERDSESLIALNKPLLEEIHLSLGRDHSDSLELMFDQANAYKNLKNLHQAELIYKELFELLLIKQGPQHQQTLAAMVYLGECMLRRIKYAEASALLRECVAASENVQPDEWNTFSRKSLLGGALTGQAGELKASDPTAAKEKLAEAETLLSSGYAGLKVRENKIPVQHRFRITQALERLVELYSQLDNPDEAAKWQKEIDARAKTN